MYYSHYIDITVAVIRITVAVIRITITTTITLGIITIEYKFKYNTVNIKYPGL